MTCPFLKKTGSTIAQGLSSIVLMSRAASSAPNPTAHLKTIETVAQESLEQARRFVTELATPLFLPSALESLVVSHREQARALGKATTFDLHLSGDPGVIADPLAQVLERVAREGLANAAQHAGAARVVVTLSVLAGKVALDIADDGAGIRNNPVGYGLMGLRQRVESAGGEVKIEPRHPGTVLSVIFDLED